MSGLKKLLKGKKKSPSGADKKDKKGSSYRSSTGSLSGTPSGSNLQLADSSESLGYLLKEKDLSKFLKAAWQGDLNKLKQLSGKKVNWNETDKEHRAALHLACARGHSEIVDYLVANGANANKNDSEGKTPLMKACENNSPHIVEVLLKSGAETNVYDVNHMSAMHIAAANGNVDIGTALADRDAKLDSKDTNQVTPLHICCAIGHIDFVEFLISEYAQVNCVDYHKRTPIMAACLDGHIDIVRLLLDHEADTTMTDKNGLTAEELATQNGYAPISALIVDYTQKKNKKSVKSPLGSIHSKGSAHDLYSPTAQALSNMFSPASATSQISSGAIGGSIFGGPAMNVGKTTEKSEDSHSEDLGDDSWADSDTESEFDKKPKGPNFSTMLKKTEKSLPKVSESPSLPPNPTAVSAAQSKDVNKTQSTRDKKPDAIIEPKQTASTKLSWQDSISEGETESKWDDSDENGDDSDDDNDLEDQFASGIVKNRNTPATQNAQQSEIINKAKPITKDSSETKKNASAALTLLSIPPPSPLMDLDASANSVDFDSSMPDDSFSELPLSDMDGSKNKNLLDKLFMDKIKEKKEDEESVWDDSTAVDLSQNEEDKKEAKQIQSKPVEKKLSLVPPASGTDKQSSNSKVHISKDEDASDWDSESAMPSEDDDEPSEEVLPPHTPEPGSEFEPSSSGDEDESDFSLEEITKKVSSPRPLEDKSTIPQKSSIFQTEIATPNNNKRTNIDDNESESDDEIEQMLNMNKTAMTKKPSIANPPIIDKPTKITSGRQKQLVELGLDIGSDVSSVSDPEGLSSAMDAPDGFEDPIKLERDDPNTSKRKVYDAMGLILSDDEETQSETESESEWEKQQRQKKLEKVASLDKPGVQSSVSKPTDTAGAELLRKSFHEEEELEKEKEAERIRQFEAAEKERQDLLNAEVAEQLRMEKEAEGVVHGGSSDFGESSSDFSFSQGDGGMPGMDDTKDVVFYDDDVEDDISEDEAEAILLKQMEVAEANVETREGSKDKDKQIKAQLNSILDRAKSPKQILQEKRDFETAENEKLKLKEKALKESEREKELEFQKHQKDLKKLEEARIKKLEQEEEARLQAILEKEKKANEKHEERERLRKEQSKYEEESKKALLEKEVEDRRQALKEEEDNTRNALKKEEKERRNAFEREENERKRLLLEEEDKRRQALLLEEVNKRKELEHEAERQKKELEEEEKLRREKLREQEDALKLQLQANEDELLRIGAEKAKQNKAFELTKSKMAEMEKFTEDAKKNLTKEKEEILKRTEVEENRRIEEIENREMEVNERLRKLEEDESNMKLRLSETSMLENSFEDFQRKNLEMKDGMEMEEQRLKEMRSKFDEEEKGRKRKLSEEYKSLRESFEQERTMKLKEVKDITETERQKLLLELANEEEDRRRKLSEEGRKFREELEKEREHKLNELFNRSEDDKEKFLREVGNEQRLKALNFEKEAREKENALLEKMKRTEEESLKELDRIAQKRESETNEKLRRMEEDKKAELQRKETELFTRLQNELSRKNTKVDLDKEEYSKRFHELEKESRLREQQLELQLMELREKQIRNEISINRSKQNTVLKSVPVEEIMISAVQRGDVQSAVLDSLDNISPEEEINNNSLHPIVEDEFDNQQSFSSPARKMNINERLGQSEYQRENAMEKISALSPVSIDNRRRGSPKKRNFTSPERGKRNAFNSLLSDIQPISSSNHEYTFDHQNSMRFLKGASTPKGNSDETVIGELYDELQDTQRRADIFREKSSAQERIKREMEGEMEEMHRTIEALGHSQNEKERSRLDVDLELQSAKYKLEQEMEARTVSERLCSQLKDQLNRSEKKLMREAESRQAVELSSRRLQSEMKNREQTILKLEAEMNELQLTLETEKDSSILREEMYQEQLRQHETILHEAQKTSHNHVQAMTKLELLNETRRNAETTTDTLKMELAKAKGELSRALSQLDEKRMKNEKEKESLNEKVQTKTEELTAIERKLFQVQLQYDNERSNKETIETQLSLKLDNEMNSKQQFEAEVTSLKNRLENSNREIDRLGDQKAHSDKDSLSSKEMFMLEKSQLEKELALTQQQLKVTEEKLLNTETQLTEINGELRVTGMSLAEHKDEVVGVHKDFRETKDTIHTLERELRDEKYTSNKLENKVETANQKISLLQDECTKLQRELDQVKERYTLSDREAVKKQESLNTTLNDIKDKTQEERTTLLVRNEQNNLLIDKLQNQLEQREEQLRDKIAELRQLTQDLQETRTSLSNVKAEKNIYAEERENALEENSGLKQSIAQYESKVDDLEKNNLHIQQDFYETRTELDKTVQITNEANQRLAAKSNDIEKLKKANVELTGTLQDIKRQNIQIEVDLREDKAKAEVLLLQLRNANEARENLETLLNNIKSNNVVLEEKLHTETLNRSQREREAEEHKGLWESEVKSRSKLGVQLIDFEKQRDELKSQVEDEKKKTRKVAELKKGADNKLELYEQRSSQHQKEVAALRNKLKQYQRKLKSYEGGESGMPAMRAEFQKERELMASNVSKLRRQLDQLSTRLTHEQEMRNNAEKCQRDQMKELTELKTKEKVHSYEMEKSEARSRASQMELAKQKDFFERNYIAQDNIEEFKQSLETKCRLDLNKKLQEVNMHLEEQALAREAFDKIRNDKEIKNRKEFEDTIIDLKSELSLMRTSLHVGFAKRDTSQHEAKRYKDLFETERSSNDKLADKLNKTTERLSTERNRTNHLFDETISKYVPDQFYEESPKRNRSMSPRFMDNLDFNKTSSYRPVYSTPTATSRSVRITSPEKDLLLSSIKRRSLLG